jgi:hypothetical protein
MRGFVAALGAKRDALISLGADTRLEREREPIIRTEKRSRWGGDATE